jgi:hypothetical protein
MTTFALPRNATVYATLFMAFDVYESVLGDFNGLRRD